jgi:hypothetical protein
LLRSIEILVGFSDLAEFPLQPLGIHPGGGVAVSFIVAPAEDAGCLGFLITELLVCFHESWAKRGNVDSAETNIRILQKRFMAHSTPVFPAS